MGTVQENKAIVRGFFESVTAGEFDDAAGMVDPTGRWNMPRRGIVYTLAEQVNILRDENMTFDVAELTAEENRVSALVRGFMTRPNGAQYHKTYHFLIKVDRDRIVDVDMYDDGGLAERISAETAQT
jgi:ketosteroid isomerase-like protein